MLVSGAAGCRHLAHDPVEHRHLQAAAHAAVPQPVDQERLRHWGSPPPAGGRARSRPWCRPRCATPLPAGARRPARSPMVEASTARRPATRRGRAGAPPGSPPARMRRSSRCLRRGRRRVLTDRAHESVDVSAAQVLDLGVVEARQLPAAPPASAATPARGSAPAPRARSRRHRRPRRTRNCPAPEMTATTRSGRNAPQASAYAAAAGHADDGEPVDARGRP